VQISRVADLAQGRTRLPCSGEALAPSLAIPAELILRRSNFD